MAAPVVVCSHPLIQHKLTLLRCKSTDTGLFRSLLAEVSSLLAYEVLRDLPLVYEDIETPIAKMRSPKVESGRVVLVSILRAGNGLLQGMLQVLPLAKVGHIGLYRDPKTLGAVEYYLKLPERFSDCDAIVVDPMLATGNSAVAAVERIKQARPRSVKFVCLLAAPEGLKHLQQEHPDVAVFTAAVDERLDEHGYIVPGLGDAGDRLYGTK